LRLKARTLWFVVRVYGIILIYLQVALLVAGNGMAIFPWGAVTLGPRLFGYQGIIFVLGFLGLVGSYIADRKKETESRKPTAN
jgi:hypothetical protein